MGKNEGSVVAQRKEMSLFLDETGEQVNNWPEESLENSTCVILFLQISRMQYEHQYVISFFELSYNDRTLGLIILWPQHLLFGGTIVSSVCWAESSRNLYTTNLCLFWE